MKGTAVQETPWKILIVDDEPEIHVLTRTVLKGVEFEGRPLEFLSAYNAPETRSIMAGPEDIALVLMDVIMEEDDTGLELIRHIREDLKNHLTRIILRTGHPGEAPERRIIIEYEINDYKEKVDLTSNKLFTSVIKSLRNYKDLYRLKKIHAALERSREDLTRVIESSKALFGIRDLDTFYRELLELLAQVLDNVSAMMIVDRHSRLVLRAYGSRQELVNTVWDTPLPLEGKEKTIVQDRLIIRRTIVSSDEGPVLLVETDADPDENLLRNMELFIANAVIVYQNLLLGEDTEASQAELIDLIGDVVEERDYEDNELVTHISRVRDFVIYMARKLDYPEEEIAILRNAVPLHDIGKIGIHDGVLQKKGPDRLNDEEFEIMKGHARIGYEILREIPWKLAKVASLIAHQHHERWDGRGYPQGLAGEDIHEFGRMTCIADVFDALTSPRCYRPEPWSVEKTMNFIREGRGTQFDPKLVDLFLEDPDEIHSIMARHRDDPDSIRELPSSLHTRKDSKNGETH